MKYPIIDAVLLMILSFTEHQVLGLPHLTSSIGSQLSGEYCPGSVTLTCNALGFGESGLIDWYISDTLLARYIFDSNHKFPFAVMVQSSLKAVAQISSSSLFNGQFNFENFTLSVDLEDLLPFQGQNMTCGTIAERSNVFNINKFTILDLVGILNVTYLAVYQGTEGELVKMDIQWKDLFELAMCEITSTYIVQLVSSKGITSSKTLTTQNCTNNLCLVQFSSDLDKTVESYKIYVIAFNKLVNDSFMSFTTIMNTIGNMINGDICNNLVSITCSTFISENCFVNSMDIKSPVVVVPGDTYHIYFDKNPQDIEITIQINSTILVHNFTFSRGSCNEFAKYVYVHIIWSMPLAVLLVMFCSATLYVIVRFKVKKGKNDTIEMKQNQVYGFIDATKIKTNDESFDMKCNQVYGLTSDNTFKEQEEDIDKNYYAEVDIPGP